MSEEHNSNLAKQHKIAQLEKASKAVIRLRNTDIASLDDDIATPIMGELFIIAGRLEAAADKIKKEISVVTKTAELHVHSLVFIKTANVHYCEECGVMLTDEQLAAKSRGNDNG